MKDILVLVKVYIISAFGLSSIKYELSKDRKKLWKPLVFLVAVASLIPMYIMYINLLENIYFQLSLLDQESTIFTLVMAPLSILILILGLPYVLSTFYFARDIEQLVPLPLKEYKIVVSKFLTMLIYEYVTIIPFYAPVFLIAFRDFGGVSYILTSLITVLFLPVIPLGIDTVLVMFLMRFTNIKGKKDLIRNISMFFMLFVIIGFQALMSNMVSEIPAGGQQEFIMDILAKSNGLMELVGRIYPPSLWFGKSLALSGSILGAFYAFLNIAISTATVFGIGLLGNVIYINTLLEKNDYVSNVKKRDIKKIVVKRPKWMSIFLNDFRLVMRTPVYMFNCFSISFILPVLLLIMPLISGSGDEVDLSSLYIVYKDYFELFTIAFFAFVSTANPTASTTFSREGKSHWITRTIPVSPSSVFIGRIVQPMLLQVLTIALMEIGFSFLMPVEMRFLLVTAELGIIVSLPINAVGILIDALIPKLDWNQPQVAVKQNLNVLFNMLIGVGYILLLGYLVYKMISWNVGLETIYLFIVAVSVILFLVLYKVFENSFMKKNYD